MKIGDLVRHQNTQETFLIISLERLLNMMVFRAISVNETSRKITFSIADDNMFVVSPRQ